MLFSAISHQSIGFLDISGFFLGGGGTLKIPMHAMKMWNMPPGRLPIEDKSHCLGLEKNTDARC